MLAVQAAHPTRFEHVTFAFGGNGPSRRPPRFQAGLQCLYDARRDALLGLGRSEKNLLPPLRSGSLRTAAAARDCTPGPSGVRIDADRRTANSHPSSFARVGGVLRYSRRGGNGREQSRVTSSIQKSEEPKTIPFGQRLACTISEACEVTGLGTGQLATTTVGRRRLVRVSSLQALLDVNSSEAGHME